MKTFKLNLGTKIFLGFFVLIFIFVLNAFLSIFTLDKSTSLVNNNFENVIPSKDAIIQFSRMTERSKMLITNWVYLRSNTTDKQALRQLHEVEYPALNTHMKMLMQQWDDKKQVQQMDTIFNKFEALLQSQKEIMNSLVSFEDYESEQNVFMASTSIDNDVLPLTSDIISRLAELEKKKIEASMDSKEEQINSFSLLRNIILFLGAILTTIGLISSYITASSITKPVNYIKDVIIKLGLGVLPEESNRKFNKDEIGEMAKAVEKLVAGLKETSLFAENIGSGNLKASYQPLSENDVLGNALLGMRDNLQKVAEEDKKRNWATEGQAKFGEILRSNNNNIAKLSDDIIINLVKYLDANQGGLFIVNDDEGNEPYLSLTGCYAWSKKKYIEQKIYFGEGLTGQAWQEQDTLYITDIPEDYITITSGLGEANPRSILIVPLKINDKIYGVVEMASFNEFEPYQIEFVQKIGESIASTISTARINERTSKLLEESQMLTEQMRAQEEEMRQNMEELQATQEEMQRAQKSTFEKEKIFNNTSLIIEVDQNFSIVNCNDLSEEYISYNQRDLIGQSISKILVSQDSISAVKARLNSGRTWKGFLNLKSNTGASVKVKAVADIMNHSDDYSFSYLFIMTDINELVTV